MNLHWSLLSLMRTSCKLANSTWSNLFYSKCFKIENKNWKIISFSERKIRNSRRFWQIFFLDRLLSRLQAPFVFHPNVFLWKVFQKFAWRKKFFWRVQQGLTNFLPRPALVPTLRSICLPSNSHKFAAADVDLEITLKAEPTTENVTPQRKKPN